MKINLKFGTAVTVIPAAATEKIISGAADPAEIAVLLAVARFSDMETETEEQYIELLTEATGLDADTVNAALAFWRGASVITVTGKGRAVKVSEPTSKEEVRAAESKNGAESNTQPVKKLLMREELPKYDPETISAICGKNGGELRQVIDQCQQLLERMFNPSEVAIIAAMNDHLGLEPEYILMLFGYYARKKPGCRLHYIEKSAYTLVNDGITTPAALEEYIKGMERYDGVAGRLRKLLGIGDRAFTKKENARISHWINDLGFDMDVIEFCYEITVDSIKEFKFDYADKVLEGWYAEGVRDLDGAKTASESFKAERAKKPISGAGGITESSFDGEDFLALAIKRSMG